MPVKISTVKKSAEVPAQVEAPEVEATAGAQDNPPFAVNEAPAVVITKNGAQGTATVVIEQPNTPVQSESVPVGEPLLTANPIAEIEYSTSMTRNLGNFESIKFGVTIRMPCEATAEDVEETYGIVKEWVEDKVNSINAEIDEQLS